MFGNVASALKNVGKSLRNVKKKLLMSDGKRCKCITNRWRTLECIVMHSKCVEMHSNANFVKPVFPKDGHKCG